MSVNTIVSRAPQELFGFESEHPDLYFPGKLDLTDDGEFPDYLEPNEKSAHNIKPHLIFSKKGRLVETGGERAFFALMFSPVALCEGVTICDINPKIKAYIDFNVLLLRISESMEEYEKLSSTTLSDASFAERISIIGNKLESTSLPARVKKYYRDHINDFGCVYLKSPKRWRDSEQFNQCKYFKNERYFRILKQYAVSGKIACAVRDINDLTFLNGKTISVVDVSNVPNYCILNFLAGKHFHPRVIWTDLISREFVFQSYVHQPLTARQSNEFDELLDFLKSCTFPERKYLHGDEFALWLTREQRSRNLGQMDPFNASLGAIRSLKTLEFLRWYCCANTIVLLGEPINMATKDIEILNEFTSEEIVEICEQEDLRPFKEHLVKAWRYLEPNVYLSFAQVEGWTDAFEKHLCSSIELDQFLNHMNQAGLLEKFTLEFGKERLISLQKKCEEIDLLIL